MASEYRSQPIQFTFTDAQKKTHTYVPDFMVWKTTGEVEIHEVTLTARQDKESIQAREQAAREICQMEGWRYVIHTEATLPQATEEANLLALYRYRPTIYANTSVSSAVRARLLGGASREIGPLITEIAQVLPLPRPTVVSALCHLLWHQVIETDLTSRLLFVNAALAPDMIVRLGEKGVHA